MIDAKGLLMIEPSSQTSQYPVIDQLTKKMVAAWRSRKISDFSFRGFHRCNCGVISDNKEHHTDGRVTNSLAIHYLAYHREEVPKEELEKVAALVYGEQSPTEKELVRLHPERL